METQKSGIGALPPEKAALRKKGFIYLAIFIIFLAIGLIMYSAGINGGIIYAFVSLAWVVFLILAVVTLIRAYMRKQ